VTDHVARFLHLVAWFVLVGASIRVVATVYAAATYPNSSEYLLDKLHKRKRTFNALPSLVWACLAAAWLCAGGD
jgi:hypothetical protein